MSNYLLLKDDKKGEILMAEFKIFTDSSCDLSPELLKEWGVEFSSLTFRFDGDDKEYIGMDMPTKEFYDKMREGGIAKTAAVNTEVFKEAFEGALSQGYDVLYIAFSSGLSTTYNSGRIAALELSEKYPDRKVIAVDTLSASAGFGLIVYSAVQKKNNGASIEEVRDYVTSIVPNLCHWFTVDDLVYLKRGGRISPAVAFVGSVLGIKPVLHMDDAGHLVNVTKVRGRRNAVSTLADKFGELALEKATDEIFISHADCMQDAEYLAGLLKDRYGATVKLITDVGPVIGAHSGPGTLALFFFGKNR